MRERACKFGQLWPTWLTQGAAAAESAAAAPVAADAEMLLQLPSLPTNSKCVIMQALRLRALLCICLYFSPCRCVFEAHECQNAVRTLPLARCLPSHLPIQCRCQGIVRKAHLHHESGARLQLEDNQLRHEGDAHGREGWQRDAKPIPRGWIQTDADGHVQSVDTASVGRISRTVVQCCIGNLGSHRSQPCGSRRRNAQLQRTTAVQIAWNSSSGSDCEGRRDRCGSRRCSSDVRGILLKWRGGSSRGGRSSRGGHFTKGAGLVTMQQASRNEVEFASSAFILL